MSSGAGHGDHAAMPTQTSIAPPTDPQRRPLTTAGVRGTPAPAPTRGPLALNPGPRAVGDFSHLLRSHD
jgi:hypothetical protein